MQVIFSFACFSRASYRFGLNLRSRARESRMTSISLSGWMPTLAMRTIEEVSEVPAEKYIPAALKAQKAGIEHYRARKERGEV